MLIFDAQRTYRLQSRASPLMVALIGMEIQVSTRGGERSFLYRAVYSTSRGCGEIHCSDSYELQEHTSEVDDVAESAPTMEVDPIGVSPDGVRRHLVQRDLSRDSPLLLEREK